MLAAAFGLTVGWAAHAPAEPPAGSEPAAQAVAVLPARLPAALDPLAAGVGVWLRERLSAASLEVLPRAAVSSALPAQTLSGAKGWDLAAVARALPGALLLDTEMRFSSGTVELRFALYDPREPKLIASHRVSGPLADLGSLLQDGIMGLFERLGSSTEALGQTPPPRLVDLAAYTRAVRALEHNDFARAWRSIEGRMLPPAVALRGEIDAASRLSTAPKAERARLLIAQGQLDAGWLLVRDDTAGSDAVVALAAGENAEARSNPRQAAELYQRAVVLAPESPTAQLDLGKALTVARQSEAARSALERAEQLDPADMAAPLALASLDSSDPSKEAPHHLEAGRRAAAQFDVATSERELERAADLDRHLLGRVRREQGALHATLGEPAKALLAYEGAVAIDGHDGESWLGLGAARLAGGDLVGAEKAYESALQIGGESPGVLLALGEIYTETGRAAQAVPRLEKVAALLPADTRVRHALARALAQAGDPTKALALLSPAGGHPPSSDDLRLSAEIERGLGDTQAAQAALAEAARLDPETPHAAPKQAEASRPPSVPARAAAQSAEQGGGDGGIFKDLVAALPKQDPILHGPIHRVAIVDLHEQRTWGGRILAWLEPWELDLRHLGVELAVAVGTEYELIPMPEIATKLNREISRLGTDRPEREDVALVNELLETDGVIVAQIRPAHSPAGGSSSELQVSMLIGRSAPVISMVSQSALLPYSATSSTWNPRPLLPCAALAILLLLTLRRGAGSLVVAVEHPHSGEVAFVVRVSPAARRKPGEPARLGTSPLEQRLVGRELRFRNLPVGVMTVAVSGIPSQAASEKGAANCGDEKSVEITPGKTARVDFDFRPKQCLLEVAVVRGETPVKGAGVALFGQPRSVRFSKTGVAQLNVAPGTYTVVAGHEDRVAEQEVVVASPEKISVTIDLEQSEGLVFRGCPDAVEPYLLANYRTASQALEAAGQKQAAHAVRASHHRARGEHQLAASHSDKAQQLAGATELREASASSSVELKTSAHMFEAAGDSGRAAETYREAGDFLAAARAYEATYDYANAIECYRQAGEEAKLAELLEKTGDHLEAAKIAHKRGDLERAVANLQQVDLRQPEYPEACQMLAEICQAQGDIETAVHKFEEAITASGGDDAALALHERLAQLLESAGRSEQALATYELIQRRDPRYPNVTARIEALKKPSDGAAAEDPLSLTAAGAQLVPESVESRFELLGELGRGRMGTVFRARDLRRDRLVALKRLPSELHGNAKAGQLFLSEARAAAALEHPHVAKIFEAGEALGVYFLALELLDGFTLDTAVRKRGRLSARDVARVGVQITAGLQCAHAAGILHLELGSASLFFTRDKVVKILGFGLGTVREALRSSAPPPGASSVELAPELATHGAADERTDLYGLGIALFQLATAASPTPGVGGEVHVEGVSGALGELIQQLLARDPGQRPSSAAEVGERLLLLAQER
ncbi:MAG TPA: tetratricopeptide repeat protein [Myxococcota bacterium]|nr:tetratricopeptide repeat protein [Myxococcota bacterium]